MALMSTLYSPKAQWALGDATSLIATDRSGNAENLGSFQANVRPAPDLRIGFVRPVNNSSGFFINKTGTYVRTLGELTILCRGYFTGTGSRRALCVFGAATAGEVSNTVFDFAVSAGDLLTYRHMHDIKVDDTVDSTITVEIGHERFFGLRRDAAGTAITFSYGDFTTLTHNAQTVANAPTGGTSSTLRIGGGHSSADTWLGGISDMCIWHSVLTDQQVADFWEESMSTDQAPTDVVAPTVSAVVPADLSSVAQADNITFDVTDAEDTVALLNVDVAYDDGSTESIYDGEAFGATFNAASSITPTTGGYSLDISRDDGWYDDFTLHIAATDTAGNVLFDTLSYTVSNPPASAVVVFDPISGSSRTRFQSVDLDITDDVSVVHSVITAEFTDGTYEIVFDGTAYADGYSGSSTTPISGGTTYTVARDGGWLAGLTLRARVLDSDDNITTASATYTITNPTPSADSTLPVITITSPTPGSEITVDTPLVGTITDDTLLAKFMLAIRFPVLGRTELAWNGTSWQPPYSSLSSLSAISGGFTFSIRRTGGWPVPTDSSLTEEPELLIYAVDGDGNEGI